MVVGLLEWLAYAAKGAYNRALSLCSLRARLTAASFVRATK